MKTRPAMNALAGCTFVSYLTGTAVGLLAITAALSLYGLGRMAWQSAANQAEVHGAAQFAVNALVHDIRLAGFWGRHNSGASVRVSQGLRVHCGKTDVSTWALKLALAVESTDDAYLLPCRPHSRAVDGTDVLVLRRASALPQTPRAGRVQVVSNSLVGELFDDGIPPQVGGFSAVHDLKIHAWYLDRDAVNGPGHALRRLTLVAGGRMQNQEIIPGVEDFQIQLGLDTDFDGDVERYADPDIAATVDAAGIAAVRFRILLRATDEHAGTAGATTWDSIDRDRPPLHFNDDIRRIAVTRTVFLRNAESGT